MMRSKAHHKRADGGTTRDDEPKKGKNEHEYNAKGSPEAEDEVDEKPGFKKGGKAKRDHKKEGGHVEGHKPEHRADRAERGAMHHKRKAGGRTPYSSGSNDKLPTVSIPGRGHEDTRPPEED